MLGTHRYLSRLGLVRCLQASRTLPTLFDLECPSLAFYALRSSPKRLSLVRTVPEILFLWLGSKVNEDSPQGTVDTVQYDYLQRETCATSVAHGSCRPGHPWLVGVLQSYLALWFLNLGYRGYAKKLEKSSLNSHETDHI